MIINIYFKDLKSNYEQYDDLVFNYISELNNLSSFLKEFEKIDNQSKDKFVKELERHHNLIKEIGY